MNGRILATVETIVAIVSSGSDNALAMVDAWTNKRGIELRTVSVGDDVEAVYESSEETLGVTLGGDGTYLEGVRAFAPRAVPILGVNTGTLAFLATVSPDDLEDALSEIIRGRASIDIRQQLQVDAPRVESTGINDVMIEHVPPENPVDRKITDLHVYVDGEYVGEYQGSGVAVATPTGSTGVSLSAGGPVHHPKDNETLQIIPLQTHQMGVRPLVVSANADVTIVPDGPASLLVDGGRSHTELAGGEHVHVRGADVNARVVRTSYDDTFFATISEKLGWGVRAGRDDGAHGVRPDRGVSSITGAEEGDDLLSRGRTVAAEAARSAGPSLCALHGQTESVEHKSDKADIVTEADYISERIISTAIENEFPDHGILSEETVTKETDSRYTWLVDPLDGTGNFAHGNPNYAISIALLDGNEPTVGVVYVPETDELFTAIRGEQAQRNGEPISTTDRDRLDKSMLLSGYDPDGAFLSHCYHETRGVRRLGCAALNLCFLASGSADAVWEHDTYPWDVAAGVVLVRAAGGQITDADGNPYALTTETEPRRELIGTNTQLHPELLDHLTTMGDGRETAQTD